MNTTKNDDVSDANVVSDANNASTAHTILENAKIKTFGWILVVLSTIAWLASWTLVLERLELYKDPTHIPSCDFGLFLSCSTIMKTPEASLLGFPNPLLGIVGFAITGTIGVFFILLSQQSKNIIPRWFFVAMQAGLTIVMATIIFFWYTSVFKVMFLCPWCMVVWAMVIPLFIYTTAWNASNGVLGAKLQGFGKWLREWNWVAVIAVYALIVGSILFKFGEYIF